MNRLTRRTDSGWEADDPRAALERLAAYEDLYEQIERRQSELTERLEVLRAGGRQKTVAFRELFGEKLMDTRLLALFKSRGL